MKCNHCGFDGTMDGRGEIEDEFYCLTCPQCGRDPTTKPGYAYSQGDGDHCTICGARFGAACDGVHPVCPTHGVPIVSDCLRCEVEAEVG